MSKKKKTNWKKLAEQRQEIIELYRREDTIKPQSLNIEEREFKDIRHNDIILIKKTSSWTNYKYYELARVWDVDTTWLHKHRYFRYETISSSKCNKKVYEHKNIGKKFKVLGVS